MKKLLMLSIMMTLSLTACGGSESSVSNDSSQPTEAIESVESEESVESVESVESLEESGADSEGDASLWDVTRVETPDLSNTTWSFSGGYVNGEEMTQEKLDSALETYGGTLQFKFDADGGAQMVQGNGTLEGTYEYLDDGSVGVIFDNNGTELRYACIFTETDELIMIAIPDETGKNGIYFVQ